MSSDPTLPAGVTALLRRQSGVATRRQLLDAGTSRSALQWRLEREWRLVLPRVVAAHRGTLSERQRLVAAQLYAGRGAVLTSMAAASWHGVTVVPPVHPVHVLVPRSRAPQSTGFVVVRRTTRVERFPFTREPLVLASRARAVADAARDSATVSEARAIVIEAAQRGLVRLGDLRHELEAGPRRESLMLRRAVQDAEAGSWSRPEADLARVCRGSRLLPEPWLNPDVLGSDGTLLPRPDGWFDDVALAVQVHSREYHDDPVSWDETVMSDGIYAEYGIAVVGVTPRSVQRQPEVVLRRIERAYSAAARRGRPDVVAMATAHGLVSS